MFASKQSLAICMPVYNESDGITEFIQEIFSSFQDVSVNVVIINDYSSDETTKVLSEISNHFPIKFYTNEKNLGHGVSTLRALQKAMEEKTDYILAVDGDGQFIGAEMRTLFNLLINTRADIAEGIRRREEEPVYRRMTSVFTRFLVRVKSKKSVADANTPLRIYRSETLSSILRLVNKDNPIPNLYISALSRALNLKIVNLDVRFVKRRGNSQESTSWGKSLKNFPSRRFLKFCIKSLYYWIRKT